jgi:signal peptidase I
MHPLIRWFTSRAVRDAVETRKQVRIVLESQRDLLVPRAVEQLEAGIGEFEREWRAAPDAEGVRAAQNRLEQCATKWLQPYPNASIRENIKEFLVSGVMILAVFCFFIQPMKIPSGSAQPTLYGNVVTPLPESDPRAKVPPFWGRLIDWFRGTDYHVWTTRESGRLEISPVQTMGRAVKFQRFSIGSDGYSVFWPPDHLERDCGVRAGTQFQAGQTVLRFKIDSGDRLFVDRFTYNFRRPTRGEVIVFTSTGIPRLIQNTHYIKRLIATAGEHVRIGDDRHVIVNGKRLDNTMRHFERVYAFSGPPRDSVFSGHANAEVALAALNRGGLPSLTAGELIDLPGLANKLRQQSDPVSAYLWSRLSEPTRQALAGRTAGVTAQALADALVADLNRVIAGEPIFERQRFAGIAFSKDTESRLARNPTGLGRARLNRLLLQDAYPAEIAVSYGLRMMEESMGILFPDETAEFVVRPHHYLAFGDNTMNSFDGRGWGDFPQQKVVGRACFVFWPLTDRFGLVWW